MIITMTIIKVNITTLATKNQNNKRKLGKKNNKKKKLRKEQERNGNMFPKWIHS